MTARIVVLVSGTGSNMAALVDACGRGDLDAEVVAVGADRECAGIERAARAGIPTFVAPASDRCSRAEWSAALRDVVLGHRPDLVVCAGFMRILAPDFVDAFAGRVINLHPSLLPAFPGAHAVRDALGAGVDVTGTTVHYVDYEVDHGPVVLQERVPVRRGDTEESLHERIKTVEQRVLVDACARVLAAVGPVARMPAMGARRALISVSDKTGVVELARGLVAAGFEVLSSGGTAQALHAAGVEVTPVAEVTGAPEILDGRVKTLHPRIHGGILADRRKRAHRDELEEHDITPIDVVVCNLYPFEHTVARAGVSEDEAVEHIDIGGPAMVRAAAKNFASVAVVVHPDRYGLVLKEIEATGGVTLETRRELALEAFMHTASYDAAIARYMSGGDGLNDHLFVAARKSMDLRYGENPHQRAALYRSGRDGVAGAEQLGGKELSYNNLLDTDAAWRLVCELPAPAAAIVKHANPCGVAVRDTVANAHAAALDCDRTSAFGGIVALNSICDEAAASAIAQVFTEVVIAPDFDARALEVLGAKKNLRILRATPPSPAWELRRISGGLLAQTEDPPDDAGDARVVTDVQPTPEQWDDLRFAWVVAKHVKSNAIVLARGQTAVGIGAGQMSRVEATELAARRAGPRARRTVCASDAFFPFRDGLDAAVAAGAHAVVQPGGSVRDDEVIAAANEHRIAMVFTGRRHFRH